jgi:DMSO reductase family type II enzyme chaperone
MRIPVEIHEAVEQARARGAVYALLSWGLAYPDDDSLAGLGRLVDQVVKGGGEKSLPPVARHELDALRQCINSPMATKDLLESRYAELFGHAVRGACPLYELEYGRAEIVQQAGELADIAGFYSAFGLEEASGSGERVDHISVECEFVSVLCAKYAVGLQTGSVVLCETCFDAKRAFLRDHLAHWFPAFCNRVMREDPDGVYGALARLGAKFLASECDELGIKAGPKYLELRPVDPQSDTEIQCGTGGGNQLVPLHIAGSPV